MSATVTSGKTGALVTTSTNASPTIRNLPVAGFNPTINRGDDVVDLINNAAFAANKVQGASMAMLDFAMPLICPLLNADFFSRLFLSVANDTDQTNYHTATMYPDNSGGTSSTYQKIKGASWQLSAAWAPNGAGMVVSQRIGCISIDPENGTALTAPSSGAISTAGVQTFAKLTVAGASDVVAVSLGASTGLIPIGPAATGGNSNYPYVPTGLLQTDLTGSVTITQKRRAATILGVSGADATLTLAFGAAAAGISFGIMLMPVVVAKPSTLGPLYIQSTYRIKSLDGTTPITATDL